MIVVRREAIAVAERAVMQDRSADAATRARREVCSAAALEVNDSRHEAPPLDRGPDHVVRVTVRIRTCDDSSRGSSSHACVLSSRASKLHTHRLARPLRTSTPWACGTRRPLRWRAAWEKEDLGGHPFVGPAGQVFNEALADAGIDRKRVFVTNAVKHFKWRASGKRRLHERPNSAEIAACRVWLELELRLVKHDVVVALGATAAQALLGPASA